MTERNSGSGKIGGRQIGEGPYDGGSRQATLAEKRVKLTLEFKIAFHEITPETVVEMQEPSDPAEMLEDAALMGRSRGRRRFYERCSKMRRRCGR